MKILFASTSAIAIPLLEELNKKGYISCVFTSPDTPSKRGKALIPTPIKTKAIELGIPCYTPEHLNREEREIVKKEGADTLLSFSYGKIFGPKFLSLFDYTFNVHPSLLPKYRGCSPIYNTIKNLDREGGISIQKIALGIDTGDIYREISFSLDGTETNEELEKKVSLMALSLVSSVLSSIGTIEPYKQEGEPSYTSFIKKEDGKIDWNESASAIHALIRASNPWPRSYTSFGDMQLSLTAVFGSAFSSFEECSEVPGTVVSLDKKKGLKIATGNGYIYVTRVLPQAKKEMDAVSFVNGNKSIIGALLS